MSVLNRIMREMQVDGDADHDQVKVWFLAGNGSTALFSDQRLCHWDIYFLNACSCLP